MKRLAKLPYLPFVCDTGIAMSWKKETGIIRFYILLICIMFSCKKDEVTEYGVANQAPVAKAGSDTTIYIPVTDYLLKGNQSFDPNKDRMRYFWKQISGPELYSFSANESQTAAYLSFIKEGVYELELEVTDAYGVSAKDTMALTVVDQFADGIAPVIKVTCNNMMTANTSQQALVTITGYVEDAQGDRFELKLGFKARQIAGPSEAYVGANYLDHDRSVIPINNLLKGKYQFQIELNRKGLSGYDTVTIDVVDDTLSGKEYIFETEWALNDGIGMSAVTPDRQDLFYYDPNRVEKVFIMFENGLEWYEVSEILENMDAWFYYSRNACGSVMAIYTTDLDALNWLGTKMFIKVRYS